jgi:A/G-specific adenine glycosylase
MLIIYGYQKLFYKQTRVAQGLPYYLRFVEQFPDVVSLAKADESSILKLWQGLGYYSRARNLHTAAKEIQTLHKGVFPKDYDKIRALKGIGDYTAAAIASFAFNKSYAVVDGNVYRVLSRVFGIETPIDSTSGKKEFAQLAQELLPIKNVAEYNQAIMEFGAVQCVPANPDCVSCCLSDICIANKNNSVKQLPVKAKKTKQKHRYFNYLLLEYKHKIILHNRGSGDIWQGLYEFPLIETQKAVSEKQLLQSANFKQILGQTKFTLTRVSSTTKHILSHQILHARFYHFVLQNKLHLPSENGFMVVKKEDINKHALPRLIERYLDVFD